MSADLTQEARDSLAAKRYAAKVIAQRMAGLSDDSDVRALPANQDEVDGVLQVLRYQEPFAGVTAVSLAEKRRFPLYWSGSAEMLAVWWALTTTVTTLFAATRYQSVHEDFDYALSHITYSLLGRTYQYQLNAVTKDALVNSFTILVLQGVRITTFYFVTAVPLFVLFAAYAAAVKWREKKYAEEVENFSLERDQTYKTLSRNGAEARLLKQNITLCDLENIEPYQPSSFEKLVRDTTDYSARITKYCKIFALAGLGFGLHLMLREYGKLQHDLADNCQGNPFWLLATDACNSDDSLKILSTMSYLWLGMASFWFSSFAGLMGLYAVNKAAKNRFVTARNIADKAQQFDEWLEEKLQGKNRKNNHALYRDLTFYFMAISLLVLIPQSIYSS